MTKSNPATEIQGDCIGIPEQRKQERHGESLRWGLILLAVQNQPEINIQLRDLSTSGLGFSSRRAFPKDEYVALRMPVVQGYQRLILCQIKYCRSADDGVHIIGAEFLESISLPSGCGAPPAWANHHR